MNKINKHHLSALALIFFGIIAYACTAAKPVQTQERGYSTSNKDRPVYIKRK